MRGDGVSLNPHREFNPLNVINPYPGLQDAENWEILFSEDDLKLLKDFSMVVNFAFAKGYIQDMSINIPTENKRKKIMVHLNNGLLTALIITGKRNRYSSEFQEEENLLQEYSGDKDLKKYIDAITDWVVFLKTRFINEDYRWETSIKPDQSPNLYNMRNLRTQDLQRGITILGIVHKRICNSRES